MNNLAAITADAGTAAFVSTILVQLVKNWLIAPRLPAGDQRDALVRGLSYALNLILLVSFVATEGLYQPSDIIVYVGLAFGQTIAAHVGYTTIGTSQ